jgi:hypothetical protein
VVIDISHEQAQSLDLPHPRKFFIAFIRRINTSQDRHGHITYTQDGSMDVIDLGQVDRVVGRIRDRKRWTIIDRSDEIEEATFSTQLGTS